MPLTVHPPSWRRCLLSLLALCLVPASARATPLDVRVQQAAGAASLDAARPPAGEGERTLPAASAEVGAEVQRRGDMLRRQFLSLQPDDHFFHSVGVFRDGAPAGLEFFGGNAQAIFGHHTTAHQLMRRFRQDRVAGTIASGLGMAALLADFALIIADSGDAPVSRGRVGAYLGLAVGGSLACGVGGSLLAMSQAHLMRAVAAYNTDLIDHTLSPQGSAPAAAVRWGLHGVGLALQLQL